MLPNARNLLTLLPLAFFTLSPTTSNAQELPETWQEQQDFRSGPTPFEPLMEFWYELDAMSELVSMQPLTRTRSPVRAAFETILPSSPLSGFARAQNQSYPPLIKPLLGFLDSCSITKGGTPERFAWPRSHMVQWSLRRMIR